MKPIIKQYQKHAWAGTPPEAIIDAPPAVENDSDVEQSGRTARGSPSAGQTSSAGVPSGGHHPRRIARPRPAVPPSVNNAPARNHRRFVPPRIGPTKSSQGNQGLLTPNHELIAFFAIKASCPDQLVAAHVRPANVHPRRRIALRPPPVGR